MQADLILPSDEVARQAVDALGGYVYQLTHSLHAWLALPPNEFLLLEVAQDYATVAQDAITMFQVKAVQASVTLRSKGVVDAIASLRGMQEANPGKVVRLTFLTTSSIGQEQGLVFPGGVPGLVHWRAAARDGSDVSTIRQVLLSLRLPPAVGSWIEEARPDELREGLLRRIHWACGTEGLDSLNRAVLDRITTLAPSFGFVPSDAARIRDALLATVLGCVTSSTGRRLTFPGLLRGIEDATMVAMPLSAIRGLPANNASLAGAVAHSALIASASVPLPSRATDRRVLVEELRSQLSRHGALWLHGSSGIGKTILAQLVASASTRPWFILQLRDCSGPDLDARLAAAQHAVASRRIGGIILDDLPHAQLLNVRIRLSALCQEARVADGTVIVTCAKAPPPSVEECLGDGTPAVRDAPYLDEHEVATMVAAAGGDPASWTRVVHAFCGRGHPQLVDARIGGLSRRAWPATELLAGVGPGAPAIEVEAQRDAIRSKILDELPDEASGLLYRLSVVGGAFDRPLAFALARVEPQNRRPGPALELLVGPWIEARGEDRYAISPLLDGIGERMLDKAERMLAAEAIVAELMKRDPFPGDFASTFLLHALDTGHEDALLRLSLMILPSAGRDEALDRAMARAVGVLASLSEFDQEPFLSGNPGLSLTMRLAQLRVAAQARPHRLAPVARRLLQEAREADARVSGPPFLPVVLTTLLLEQELKVRPRTWMGWLKELGLLWRDDAGSPSFLIDRAPALPGTEGWTYLQHLFASRATSLADVDDLRLMLDEVDVLGPGARPYVEVLDGPANVAKAIVQTCWLNVVDKDDFDAAGFAEAMRRVAERSMASGWHAFAAECGCVRVAVLDEYVDDAVGAAEELAALRRTYPRSHPVEMAAIKHLHGRGSHRPCISSASRLAEGLVPAGGMEGAMALRAGALSACALGDLAVAECLFDGAYRAMPPAEAGVPAFAVGLLADAARCAWETGMRRAAVHRLACAVAAAGSIDADAGPTARWAVKALAHIMLHLCGLSDTSSMPDGKPLPHGFCSRLQPPPEIMAEPTPPTIALWYMLAAVECRSGEDLGLLDALRMGAFGRRHALYETIFAGEYLSRHFRCPDASRFLAELPDFAAVAGFAVIRQSSAPTSNVVIEARAEIPALGQGDWLREPYSSLLEQAVIAFALAGVARGMPGVVDLLRSGLRTARRDTLHAPFDQAASPPPAEIGGAAATAWAAARLAAPQSLDPDTLFLVSACVWSWLGGSIFRAEIEGPLARCLARCWREMVSAQSFRLKTPYVSVPAISSVAGDDVGADRTTLAKLILAAESGVVHRLTDTLRRSLRDDASRDGQSLRPGGQW